MSQANIQDLIAAETSGAELLAALKAAELAVQSGQSGTTRPSYLAAGPWIDTSVNPRRLMYYDGVSDIAVMSLQAQPSQAGFVFEFAGIRCPDGYYFLDGSSQTRADDPSLFAALTESFTGDLNGTTTVSNLSADLRNLGLEGAALEGASGIAAGTTIVSITETAMVISIAATGSGSAVALRAFPYGFSSGSSFNLPDDRGVAIAGRDNMNGTAANRLTTIMDGKKLSVIGGSESVALTTAQLPAHSHTASASGSALSGGAHTHTVSGSTNTVGNHQHTEQRPGNTSPTVVGSGNTLGRYLDYDNPTDTTNTSSNGAHSHTVTGTAASDGAHTHTLSISVTVNNAGGGDAHSNVQPTRARNKIIKRT